MKLYELNAQMSSLQEMLEAGLTPEVEERAREILADTTDALRTKLEACAHVVASITSQAAAVKAEEDRLASRRKSLESSVKNLKQRMQEAMENAKLEKVKSPLWTIYIQPNPPSVEIYDESTLDQKWLVQPPPTPDKMAIKNHLQSGGCVDGAKLVQGSSIRIK